MGTTPQAAWNVCDRRSTQDVGRHDSHKGPAGGGFFRYWAIEAAGVVAAFRIDDSTFRDLPCYPKDLADHGRHR